MKIVLDNAQHTPHLDFIDDTEKIIVQILFCKNGLKISGNIFSILPYFPKIDDIIFIQQRKLNDRGVFV